MIHVSMRRVIPEKEEFAASIQGGGEMHVTFARTGQRRYGVSVERPDYPSLEMNPAPGYDDDLPHDFVHFVVEEELGLRRGVFGQLAAGGDAGTFRVVQTTGNAREASRTRRKQQTRGERLSREGNEQAEFSERAATICHHEWLVRSPTAQRRSRAREFGAFVRNVRSGCSPEELESLSDPVIERICERLERLSQRWSTVEVGQSVTLSWSPATR